MAAQSKQMFERATEVGQETGRRIEDSYLQATQGSIEYQRRALAIVQANFDAAFECSQALVSVKSPLEFIEVSMEHARRQFDALSNQTRELAQLAQKAATSNIEPLTNGLNSALRRTM